ncbi:MULTISPECIES: ScbR family autoregulator-binding transcription factor [Streptomyces]|uniref:ScbR family autoregulator-binding transcription factor n=2 Tax=Streptomyces TaxID=1883 RepID=A0ABU2RSR8_9ACTN|nr:MULTISPECIES: ScbR family autoregulator-binding transcription factor [unclassified Streptomyces]MBK3594041.1 TetR/AcrR family transcriptional regulator [Streptomyces sp. MBT51]MDT0430603.1 ScbR family autoregulator-binding transcription factor [Streptomyces sp. DSM 41770]
MGKHARSEHTLELLLVSAAEQFATHGFARATLADVSHAAGVTKGALFFHFPTKDALADAVQLRGLELVESTLARLRADETSCLQVIVDVTHTLNRLLREDLFLRASVRITRELPRTGATDGGRAHDFYLAWLSRLWPLVDEACRNGELPPGRSVPARTVVTAAVSGVETLVWIGLPPPDVEKWLSHLWQLAYAGAPRRIRTTPAHPEATRVRGESAAGHS